MKNKEIASIFNKMADILEFMGDPSSFRIISYRRAARILEDLAEDIQKYDEEGRLQEISGIGEGLSKKIDEYIKTGKISKYEEIKRNAPEELISMMDISGVGPKTLALIYKETGVKNVDELEKAVIDGRLRDLPGMGSKKEENILRGIRLFRASRGRIELGIAYPIVEEIVEALKEDKLVKKVSPAGSLRRMAETIGDIDILVCGKDGEKIIENFVKLPFVHEVLSAGNTKGSVIVEDGIQVDVRVVDEDSYGSALQYFTGSKEHNVKLRGLAKDKGYKISEYGIFKGNKKVGGTKEEDIYRTLGLPLIPPVLREDRGEVETAMDGCLPDLIVDSDIKGDMHVHSDWSDGASSIEEVARRSLELGYEYVAICDHSQSLRVAHGLSIEDLYKKRDEIKRIRKRFKEIKILFGTEVDIKSDGSIDYPDEVLKDFDVVIASIHTGFKDDGKKITSRILRAMENKYVNIIGHPTGRLIGLRDPYAVDIEAVLKEAAGNNVAMEINAFYDRLDLNDLAVSHGKDLGVRFAISTDSHHIDQLWMMKLGVGVARRGWLEKKDLINCLPFDDLKKFLVSRR